MNAFTIVTVVRALIAADQTDEQIARTLETMGFEAGSNATDETEPEPEQANGNNGPEPEVPLQATNRANNLRGGLAPTVKYKLVAGMTAQRLQAKLNGRQLQVATLIAKYPNGITKRDVRDKLQITNGAAMSAIHGLQTRDIVKSVPLGNPAPTASKRTAAKPAAGRVR